MKFLKRTPVFLSVLLCTFTCFAQSSQEKKYRERALEVDAEVFGPQDPMFNVNTVPQAYSQSSGVILAKKVEMVADQKSKTKFSLFYGVDKTNTIFYTLTVREKIKIQDKNALNEYSEFSFNKIRSQSSFYRSSAYSFIGIKLIKPDGTVKKIDVDAEAVNASEEKKNAYKLAIPGLQVGDIIDIYSRVEKENSSGNPIEPLDAVVAGTYPILNYSFVSKIRKNFAVVYSIANSSLKLNETRDDDFIYLRLNLQDVNNRTDLLWLYERREFPVVKINIFPGASARTSIRNVAIREGQVMQGLPKEWVDNKFSTTFASMVNSRSVTDDRAIWLKSAVKKMEKEKKLKDTDSLIAFIYYFGRFSFLYDYMSESKIEIGIERNYASTNYYFYSFLLDALNYYDIEYDLVFTVPRHKGTIYTAASADEFDFLVKAKGKKDYYLYPPTMFSIANSFPEEYEGQEAYVFHNTSIKRTGGVSAVEKLPVTKSSFNYAEEDLKLVLSSTNPQQLNIERTRTLRGNMSYENQINLSLFEEYVDKERLQLGEKTFADEIIARVGKRKSEQLLAEYKLAYLEARKKRMEYAKTELESAFGSKTVHLDSIMVVHQGNRHTQTDFVFKESFHLTGLVQKAGNNYIVNIGELLGTQVQVKTEQRNRSHNIYMPHARHYRYKISLALPEGYSAEGLDNLHKNISNETGSFISKAAIQGNSIEIEINKIYNSLYEPATNWPRMLAFLDSAFDFTQEKILLKKK